MVGAKVRILLILTVLLFSTVSALDFQVRVSPEPEASVYQPNLTLDEDLLKAEAVVENSGSIGCEFRARVNLKQGDQIIDRYSAPYRMWQGEIQTVNFYYVPINYTGNVDVNLTLDYCGKSKNIDAGAVESSNKINPNRTFKSKTLEVEERKSLISVKSGKEVLLVPQKHPPYWKVGSTRLENGKGWIEYEPSLFKKGEKIVYTVVENRTVKGKTTVVLEDEETRFEEFVRKLSNWF